jgi:hypothetical protein
MTATHRAGTDVAVTIENTSRNHLDQPNGTAVWESDDVNHRIW